MTLLIDEQMAGDNRYFYRRDMDNVIILAKTRWHLPKTVRIVNQHFNQLKVAQAPDKTFTANNELGEDFLGYQTGQEKLRVLTRTIQNPPTSINAAYFLYKRGAKKHQPNWKMLVDATGLLANDDNIGLHKLTCLFSHCVNQTR
ncbi:MAG: RNA-directed DNA polymerase [Paraglaciecola sp.]